MEIQKAVRKAVETGGFITRPLWCGRLHIKPTNEPECCVLHGKGRAPCPRWQPKAEDLMADDWEVTTEELI
ncbi:Thoeris anti-defense Tad2 family protein [Flavonifractor plautii]|uniref:Thoeris anti-defense 2-like domain-containing protein n=1 Tax=Flavonifractor plautii ATCC 29863 TaxID=411475 RepID=G9YSE6_FLAPL|nr:hypothetical protein HMPREF0372_02423 [Flavonifractor plautii ATCC 29863]